MLRGSFCKNNYWVKAINYFRKKLTVSDPPPPLSDGLDNFQSQILKRLGEVRKKCLGDLRVPVKDVYLGGIMFLVKKDFVK